MRRKKIFGLGVSRYFLCAGYCVKAISVIHFSGGFPKSAISFSPGMTFNIDHLLLTSNSVFQMGFNSGEDIQ